MPNLKVKDVSDFIKEALNMNLSTEKKKVFMAIDIAHKDMALLRDWEKLRMKKEFVMTGVDTELPTNLAGVTGVRSSTEVYFKAEEEDILSVDGRPHWVYAAQTGDDPTSAPYFNIYDEAGAEDSASVTVFYWAIPKTVNSEDDDILIPGLRAIATLASSILLGLLEHKTQEAEPFRVEYQSALQELLARYPVNARAKLPKGRHGMPLALGDIG